MAWWEDPAWIAALSGWAGVVVAILALLMQRRQSTKITSAEGDLLKKTEESIATLSKLVSKLADRMDRLEERARVPGTAGMQMAPVAKEEDPRLEIERSRLELEKSRQNWETALRLGRLYVDYKKATKRAPSGKRR